MSVPSPNPIPATLGLHLRGMGRPLPLSLIVRFEADDNYTRVHVKGYKWPLLYGYNLGAMCQRFPFMARVSKAAAVNPYQLKAVTRQGILLGEQDFVKLSKYHLRRLPAELNRVGQLLDTELFTELAKTDR